MNGRRFLLNYLVVVVAFLPLRVAGSAELPVVVRETRNAASVRPQIVPLVEKLAAALKADDSTARDKLIDEVLPGAANPANISSPFLDAYADVVNTELLKLANDPNPRVRLNVAIVAARVADKAGNARLIPTITDLLDDPHEGVVLWALKATKGVFIPAHTPAAGVQGTKLVPAFVTAAKKYVLSGPMSQAAYDTLKAVDVAGAPAAAVKSAIDATHEILQTRRDLYLKSLPEFAQNESVAISFLSAQRIYRAQSPQQQLQTIQLISDMIGLIAHHYAGAGTIVRGELAKMLETNGGALIVIGLWTNAAAKMDAFAKPLNLVRSSAAPEDVMNKAKATYEGLKSFSAWKDLKPFPTVEK